MESVQRGPNYDLICPCCDRRGGVIIVDPRSGAAKCRLCGQVWDFDLVVRNGAVIDLVLLPEAQVTRVVKRGTAFGLMCPYCHRSYTVFVQTPGTGRARCEHCSRTWYFTPVTNNGSVIDLIEPVHQSRGAAKRAAIQLTDLVESED